MKQLKKITPFTLNLGLTVFLSIILSIFFMLYAFSEKRNGYANELRILSIIFGLGLFFMLRQTYLSLEKMLGGTVDDVHAKIKKIALGNFELAKSIEDTPENSILRWLLEMQNQLREADVARKQAEDALLKANNELEQIVGARTKELIDDISKRVRIEEELQKSNERFERVIKYSPVTIYEQDLEFRFTWLKNMPANIESEQFIGKKSGTFTIKEEADSLLEYKKKVIETGIGLRKEIYAIVHGIIYYYDISIEPLRDTDGKIIGISGTAWDITKLKKTQKELLDLKFALDEHAEVTITDKFGIITYANDKFCTISKYSREELVGKNHQIIRSGYHPKEFFRELWNTIEAKKVWKGEVKNRAKDGSFYWVNATIVPFLNAEGEITQYIAIRTDITERKQNEIELKKAKELAEVATRAKSEFLATMSHEIRTPLNGVIGFTDLLLKTNLDNKQTRYLEIVNQSAISLLDLINGILDFSKIEAGKMELNCEKVNLVELVQQASDVIRFKADEKKLKILNHIFPNVPRFIYCDPIRIKQILINLLGNAVKFTKEGVIEIKIEVAELHETPSKGQYEAELLFSVKDTGIGITKTNQQKIFEAFSQADSSTTRNYGGTGLGLTISNRLLALMNSKLELESEYGIGSKFYFVLTVKVEGENIHLDESKEKIIPSKDVSRNKELISNKSIKFLIVDDVEVNILLAKNIIEQIIPNGIFIEATNGNDAIELSKKEKPDIIFMDVQMPEMNGYKAAEAIRKMEIDKRVPIIALTAGTVKEEIEKCFQSGMDDYISKPVKREFIENMIGKWLVKNLLK